MSKPRMTVRRTGADQRVQSDTFSDRELRAAGSEDQRCTRVYLGTAKLTYDTPGLLVRQLHGGRVIR